MTCLDYRSPHLLPRLLDVLENNLSNYRPNAIANMIMCLSLLGVGDESENNIFESRGVVSNNYKGRLTKMLVHFSEQTNFEKLSAFDYASVAFAIVINNQYEICNGDLLPFCLSSSSNLIQHISEHCGWVQYYLYQSLYCTDVEKPNNEIEIKKAIPFELQQSLHLRWLSDIVLNAQPQGSELLQRDIDVCLRRLNILDALINCSFGRLSDEQHCWFTGHLIKSRRVALDYDILQPVGAKQSKLSGTLSLKQRLLKKMNYHSIVIHKYLWDNLEQHEKDNKLYSLIHQFPIVDQFDPVKRPRFEENSTIHAKRMKKKKYLKTPPDAMII